jgi:ribosomal protein S18 acetylase RimI-like enzyme
MSLNYRKAQIEDAELLIRIYNLSFYEDYIRYGECPAYGRSKGDMEASIVKYPKLLIYNDDIPIGVISAADKGQGEYILGCLCVIPEYQGRGIGTQAMRYLQDYYSDWKRITLITPSDKLENVNFYTKKCGFRIDGTEMDGHVEVSHFVLER